MLEKGIILGNRYEIMEELGSGGMATVYKAKCNLLNRYVAVKVLKKEFNEDADFVKKFRREAQSAASLSHPNIVSIYDVGEDQDVHYIVMEYINGKTLKEIVNQNGAMNNDDAMQYALQIASALEHAHENQIIHRDIKSHNIILREDQTIKVTDFGIARMATSATMTNTGSILGSVHYFSPEQAKGNHTDEKSDIYSMGIVLYEISTGQLPFNSDAPVTVALKQIQDKPRLPRSIKPGISIALESIILKCLEKLPSNRYQNASMLIDDLRTAIIMPNHNVNENNETASEETRAFNSTALSEKLDSINKFFENNDYENEENEKKSNTPKKSTPKKKPIKKQSNSKKGIVIVISILILAIVGIVGAKSLIGLFKTKEAVVPDITNMTEEEAKDTLDKLGFPLVVEDRIESADVEADKIIRQDPEAGIKNKLTNPIRVIISKGAEKSIMPNLLGETKEAAIAEIKNLKLGEGKMDVVYSTLPIDTVIWQSIEAGEEVVQETIVDLRISGGSEKVFMIEYIGETLETALKDLEEKGLAKGNVSYINSDNYEKGKIIKQSIEAGSEVARNSTVDFVVSKGKSTEVEVPPPTENIKNIKINLLPDLTDVVVKVYQSQNNNEKLIYNKKHSSADSPLTITAKGSGKTIFYVYIDESLVETIEEVL